MKVGNKTKLQNIKAEKGENIEPIRVLYMEDDEGEARLFKKKLERKGYSVDLASDGEKGLAMYKAGYHDILVVDQTMPVHSGLDVIKILAAHGSMPPIIMVTGAGDEKIAVDAMKLGAIDYIVKDVEGGYLELLPSTIERALKQHKLGEDKKRAEAALQSSEARLRKIIENNADGIIIVNRDNIVLFTNPAAETLFDCAAEDLVCKPFTLGCLADAITELEIPGNKGKRLVEMNAVETE